MSADVSPNIIEDGLVLALDASDPKSYSGSGTTWTDRSGNGNNGTLVNGVGYNSVNRGVFVFDGSNDYILANNISLNSRFSSTAVSHFTWVYPTSPGQIIVELGQPTINTSWHNSNIEISSEGTFRFSTWHGSLANRVTAIRSFNSWYYVGFSYNGTVLTAYINGVSVGTANFNRVAPYNSGLQTHYALCANDSTSMGTFGNAGGQIANFNVYNRALSADEIAQNFNATRSRFGI
jgi:hypothetical protein